MSRSFDWSVGRCKRNVHKFLLTFRKKVLELRKINVDNHLQKSFSKYVQSTMMNLYKFFLLFVYFRIVSTESEKVLCRGLSDNIDFIFWSVKRTQVLASRTEIRSTLRLRSCINVYEIWQWCRNSRRRTLDFASSGLARESKWLSGIQTSAEIWDSTPSLH